MHQVIYFMHYMKSPQESRVNMQEDHLHLLQKETETILLRTRREIDNTEVLAIPIKEKYALRITSRSNCEVSRATAFRLSISISVLLEA